MNNLYNKSNGPALKIIVLIVRMINNFYGICVMSMYHLICSKVAVNNQAISAIASDCLAIKPGGGERWRGGGGGS